MTTPDDFELDESFRRRIRRTAVADDAERVVRDELAIARLARGVADARRAEVTRQRRRIAAVVVAAGASVAASFALWSRSGDPRNPVVVETPRCASVDARAYSGALPGGHRTEIDDRARVALGPDASARFSSRDGCSLEIELDEGAVDVWARSLGGGELRVVSGDATVVVHGTVFRVVREGASTTVAVHEGLVSVERGADHRAIRAGESVSVTPTAIEPRTMTEDERRSIGAVTLEPLATVVTPASVAQTPDAGSRTDPSSAARPASAELHGTDEPSAAAPAEPPAPTADLLRAAETAWREGDLARARALFHDAGSRRGAEAEAAWLRLGRLESSAGRLRESVSALGELRRRFPSGRLEAEALFLEARARRSLGEESAARSLEDALLSEHPQSPQAARVRANRQPEP